jgi:hypothetical protein
VNLGPRRAAAVAVQAPNIQASRPRRLPCRDDKSTDIEQS